MVEQDLSIDERSGSAARALPRVPSVVREQRLGDYRILREIGRGGMGVVYEAEQISLGRRVALKVLPRQVSGDRMVQERFRREARAAARLHHTNIVPVYEVGQDGDVRFYAMQFIQGQGLDAVIAELRRLRDRAGSESRIEAASGGRSLRPAESTPARASTARHSAKGSRSAAVLRSILTGRFDPGGRRRSWSEPRRRCWPGPSTGGLATPTGTGIGTSSGRIRPRTDAHRDRRVRPRATRTGPRLAHPPAPAWSSSASASSSSAILPGGTQLSSVESGRRAFFRSLAQIGRQVAGGLAYAHARGIVHRDIKPSNLLLDTEGVVWITDFGLAKGDDEGLTQSGDILGTLRYMAPERFRGEGDARADVYALGLTLYELLTLRPGFDSPDRLKLIEQIKTEEPREAPGRRCPDSAGPGDDRLKAIEKDPKARYQSAEAMGEDLGRFLADEPIRARQVSAGAILAVGQAQSGDRGSGRGPHSGAGSGHDRLASGRGPIRENGVRRATGALDADQARDTAETARTAAQIAEQKMQEFAAQADAGRRIAQARNRAHRGRAEASGRAIDACRMACLCGQADAGSERLRRRQR